MTLPDTAEAATRINAEKTLVRTPAMTRDRTSRPWESVPSQWSADGGCNAAAMSWALGS